MRKGRRVENGRKQVNEDSVNKKGNDYRRWTDKNKVRKRKDNGKEGTNLEKKGGKA